MNLRVLLVYFRVKKYRWVPQWLHNCQQHLRKLSFDGWPDSMMDLGMKCRLHLITLSFSLVQFWRQSFLWMHALFWQLHSCQIWGLLICLLREHVVNYLFGMSKLSVIAQILYRAHYDAPLFSSLLPVSPSLFSSPLPFLHMHTYRHIIYSHLKITREK